MRHAIIILAAVLIICGDVGFEAYATCLTQDQVYREWISLYNSSENRYDYATKIVVDNDGNLYVTGASGGSTPSLDDPGNDILTIKYDPAGTKLWEARYNGPGNGADVPSAIAVDTGGNVYVAGRSYGYGTDYDYATIKYDSNGTEQWVSRYNGFGNGSDMPVSIVIDQSDNVVVTGYSVGESTDFDYVTIRYDNHGIQQWVAIYKGQETGPILPLQWPWTQMETYM